MWKTTKKVLDRPIKYLPWTVVKSGSKYFMIIEKSKLEFISVKAALSWGRIPITASETSLSKYPTWKKIGFSLGSLLKTIDNNFFVVCGSNILEPEYRRIANPEVFSAGYDKRDFVSVSDIELKFHKKGEDINDIWF